MKALKTKVILSGIVLVFAFIATIGTTFAWFTVSQTATVDTLNLEVTAAENLLIHPYYDSVDVDYVSTGNGESDLSNGGQYDLLTPSNYQTVIEQSDLITAGYSLNTWRLQPATMINAAYDGVNEKELLYYSDVEARTTASAKENNAAGHYIRLSFYLLSQSEGNQDVELSDFTVTTDDNNSTSQNVVIDAIRLSVWKDDDDPTVHGGTGEGEAYTFGNNTDFSYSFTGGDFDVTGENTLVELGDTTGTDLVTTAQDEVLTSVAGNTILTIEPNKPVLVTVFIYLEGWNQFANNNVAEALFDIKFGFKFGA